MNNKKYELQKTTDSPDVNVRQMSGQVFTVESDKRRNLHVEN